MQDLIFYHKYEKHTTKMRDFLHLVHWSVSKGATISANVLTDNIRFPKLLEPGDLKLTKSKL